jgi:hypothetical protein
VTHLNTINVLDAPLGSFWMKTAYRIPNNGFRLHAVAW